MELPGLQGLGMRQLTVDMGNPDQSYQTSYNTVSDSSVITGIYINIILGILLFFCFCFAQTLPPGRRLYRFRTVSESVTLRPPDIPMTGRFKKYFRWISRTWHVTDLDVLMSCGLDALVMLKLPVLGIQFFFPVALLSMVVLVPINLSHNWVKSQSDSQSSRLAWLTVSAIEPHSGLLWVYFGLLYCYVAYGLALLYHHFLQFARLRITYIRRGDDLGFYSEIISQAIQREQGRITQLQDESAKAAGGDDRRLCRDLDKQLTAAHKNLARLQERLAYLEDIKEVVRDRGRQLNQLYQDIDGFKVPDKYQFPGGTTGAVITARHLPVGYRMPRDLTQHYKYDRKQAAARVAADMAVTAGAAHDAPLKEQHMQRGGGKTPFKAATAAAGSADKQPASKQLLDPAQKRAGAAEGAGIIQRLMQALRGGRGSGKGVAGPLGEGQELPSSQAHNGDTQESPTPGASTATVAGSTTTRSEPSEATAGRQHADGAPNNTGSGDAQAGIKSKPEPAVSGSQRVELIAAQKVGTGKMAQQQVEALQDTAPLMFLERPSARYLAGMLVPVHPHSADSLWQAGARPGLGTAPTAASNAVPTSAARNEGMQGTHGLQHEGKAGHVQDMFRWPPGDLSRLPWGDEMHTGGVHLQAVQVQRYAVLVTDVPVPPFPASAKDGKLAGQQQQQEGTPDGERGLQGEEDWLEPDAWISRHAAQYQTAGILSWFIARVQKLFPSFGSPVEMLKDLNRSAFEQAEGTQGHTTGTSSAALGAGSPPSSSELASWEHSAAKFESLKSESEVLPVQPGGTAHAAGHAEPTGAVEGAGAGGNMQVSRAGSLPRAGSARRGIEDVQGAQQVQVGASRLLKLQTVLRRTITADRAHKQQLQVTTQEGPQATAHETDNAADSASASLLEKPTAAGEHTAAGASPAGVDVMGRAGTKQTEVQRQAAADGIMQVAQGGRRSGCALWAVAREAVSSGRVAQLPRSPEYDPVSALFSELFPHEFDRACPVMDYQGVHVMMRFWNFQMVGLDTALEVLRRQHRRPWHFPCPGGCLKPYPVDSIDYLTELVGRSQRDMVEERSRVLSGKGPGTGCYVVLFKTQAAAALAAANRTALTRNTGKFMIHPAPAPNNLNWHALLVGWNTRRLMRLAMILPKIIMVLFPIAAFSSAFMQIDYVLCPTQDPTKPPGEETWSWSWYCNQSSFGSRLLKSLVVGWLPSLLLTLYSTMVLPNAYHGLAQASFTHLSLSDLDMEVYSLYYLYYVFNVFMCGVLGGTFMQQVHSQLFKGSVRQFFELLGSAMPQASNFFLNYLSHNALLGFASKLFMPHGGVGWYPFRRYVLRHYRVFSVREKMFWLYTCRTLRHGPNLGHLMMPWVIGCAFALISPLIPVFVLIYFLFGYFTWKYLVLYVFVRRYETGGMYFLGIFERLLGCLAIMVIMTAGVLAAKGGSLQFYIIIGTLPWIIWFVGWYVRMSFGPMLGHNLPLEVAARAPHAQVDPRRYIHPALNPQGLGWHPDLHLVWGGIGIWGTL